MGRMAMVGEGAQSERVNKQKEQYNEDKKE